MDYYSLEPILSQNAEYNLIIGERSNGKTFAALEYGLRQWWEKGKKMAYLRRWKEDFRGKRGDALFAALASAGTIESITGGEYTTVRQYSGRWYLAKHDQDLDKLIWQDDPFCYGFAISDQEHDKSASYPDVTTIIFDEFLTRQYYLQNEFVLFMNVLSTIIRHRSDVKVFMLGNTVNKYCPYFKEMGLKHVTEMEQGAIDVYTYGTSSLKVAVEYCKQSAKKGKASDKYFAFDNPSLAMITGGVWEIDMYPHCPRKYKKTDIVFTYFILFDDNLLQCEIIYLDDCRFTFIHEKTTDLHNEDEDIIFSDKYDPRPNWYRNLRKPTNEIGRKIASFFREDKVFYQDNEVGEVVRNYLRYCQTM